MRMQFLNQLSLSEAVVVALFLGAAVGASFIKQLRLLRKPQGSLFSRLTQAALSMSGVFFTVVVSKYVAAIEPADFLLIAILAGFAVPFFYLLLVRSERSP